jgi:hypothetical protein
MDFSHNNTVLWSVVFIAVGAFKIINSIVDFLKGGRHRKVSSCLFGIIIGMGIIACGVLPLLGIGVFVPAD